MQSYWRAQFMQGATSVTAPGPILFRPGYYIYIYPHSRYFSAPPIKGGVRCGTGIGTTSSATFTYIMRWLLQPPQFRASQFLGSVSLLLCCCWFCFCCCNGRGVFCLSCVRASCVAQQVSSFDSNRVEALRLLASMLSLPLFLDTPFTVSFLVYCFVY